MIVAITGTPGTGKSSASKMLEEKYRVLHINELIKEKGFFDGVDEQRDCLIADTEKITDYVHEKHKEMDEKEVLIIECHFSHLLNPDITIVLKTDTSVLIKRLEKKGFGKAKIEENIEAEIMDVILLEADDICKGLKLNIIDTTKISIEDVFESIRKIIDENIGV